MKNQPLHQYIGDPLMLVNASTISTAAAFAASDNLTMIPIAGASGVLFIDFCVATDVNDVLHYQIQYSSAGDTTSGATSNAAWTCTDAIFTIHPAATAGTVHSIVDVNLDSKAGFDDAAGKLYISAAAAESGDAKHIIVGVPYGGTRSYPATNAVTVVHADSSE
jgi:hypothetical protein